MRIYDISLTISHKLPSWPGDPVVRVERIAKIEEGANANLSSCPSNWRDVMALRHGQFWWVVKLPFYGRSRHVK